MQYFQAVQIGKQRANKAQMVATVIKTDDGYVTILVDEDGFTKAQTKPLEKGEAGKIFNKVLDSGIAEFSGKEIKIWADTFPTVQDELK